MLYGSPDFLVEKASTNLPIKLVSHLDPLAPVDPLYLMPHGREMDGFMTPSQIINL